MTQLALVTEPRRIGKAQREQMIAEQWYLAARLCRDEGMRGASILCQQMARDTATQARLMYRAWGAE